MIRISRNRIVDGKKISPSARWVSSARKATKKAIREKSKHEADDKIYSHKEVKAALRKIFHEKCSYCETKIVRHALEVEHFRPKGGVAESSDHPGYYWLAYDWDNLYSSCTLCNQIRYELPPYGSTEEKSRGGKGTSFPLADPRTRAMDPNFDHRKEIRLLVDPCHDYPEKHFGYTIDGKIFGKSKKGRISIETYHLCAGRLRDARQEKIQAVVQLIEMKEAATLKGDREGEADIDKWIDKWMLDDSCEYSGISRYVIANQDEFGV